MLDTLFLRSHLHAVGSLTSLPLKLRRGQNLVRQFERGLGEHFGLPYVLSVNSGTSANEAAIVGLGLQPGDEVICPATAPAFVSLAVLAAGCIPVFADVNEHTLMSGKDDVAERLSPRTRAIVAVHLHGRPAPVEELAVLAQQHGLRLVEDCAQAYDCYLAGRKVGTFGDVMTSSLHISKHMTTGEGGFIATRNPEIYRRALLYSNAGMPAYGYGIEAPEAGSVGGIPTRGHLTFGHNHRLSLFHALVGATQLRWIERFHAARQRRVELVRTRLAECPGVVLARVDASSVPNFWEYPFQLEPKVPLDGQETVRRVRERVAGAYLTFHNEVNYLEPVFQDMENTRHTPFGLALPAHVHYRLGSCPKAERATPRSLRCSVHHLNDVRLLQRSLAALREVLCAVLAKA